MSADEDELAWVSRPEARPARLHDRRGRGVPDEDSTGGSPGTCSAL